MSVNVNVIKRNGEEVDFNLSKIVNAITAANEEVDRLHQMNQYQIQAVADKIAAQISIMTHAVNVEDIQDMVEKGIMEMRGYEGLRNMCAIAIRESSPANPTPLITVFLRSSTR